jgi:hypothetical protein
MMLEEDVRAPAATSISDIGILDPHNGMSCMQMPAHRTKESRRKYSAGAPRLGQPQDWQHRIMSKGFVSERELNPHARDLRIA